MIKLTLTSEPGMSKGLLLNIIQFLLETHGIQVTETGDRSQFKYELEILQNYKHFDELNDMCEAIKRLMA